MDRHRPWTLWLAALLVAGAVAGVALYQRRTAAPGPVPSTPAPAGRVYVSDVCRVTSDHHDTLAVPFVLANRTAGTVRILRVDPVAVLPGLRPLSVTTEAGSCDDTGPAPAGGRLAPGDTLLVTFTLQAVGSACPQPVPVEASVQWEADGRTTTSSLHVLNDLGGVPFDTCPTTG
jgi:hypothetical protein